MICICVDIYIYIGDVPKLLHNARMFVIWVYATAMTSSNLSLQVRNVVSKKYGGYTHDMEVMFEYRIDGCRELLLMLDSKMNLTG